MSVQPYRGGKWVGLREKGAGYPATEVISETVTGQMGIISEIIHRLAEPMGLAMVS